MYILNENKFMVIAIINFLIFSMTFAQRPLNGGDGDVSNHYYSYTKNEKLILNYRKAFRFCVNASYLSLNDSSGVSSRKFFQQSFQKQLSEKNVHLKELVTHKNLLIIDYSTKQVVNDDYQWKVVVNTWSKRTILMFYLNSNWYHLSLPHTMFVHWNAYDKYLGNAQINPLLKDGVESFYLSNKEGEISSYSFNMTDFFGCLNIKINEIER